MKNVNSTRRRLLAAAAALPLAAPRLVSANPFAAGQPVRVLFPWAAGGELDGIVRRLLDGLGKELGTPFVMEYKPGGTTVLAASTLINARPDGQTLMIGSSSTFVINPVTREDIKYDPLTDFDYVSHLIENAFYIAARPDAPYDSLPSFIEYARSHPGEVSYASQGVGSVPHLLMEQLSELAGIKLIHVPYNGPSRVVQDLIAGHVDTAMMTQMLPALQAGRVKGLAYTGHARQPVLPDLALASETIPGFTAHVWFGLVAPRGTPAAFSHAVSDTLLTLGKDPALTDAFNQAGMSFLPSSPEAFHDKVRKELPSWQSTYQSLLARGRIRPIG
ncbi:tripartite tricarboxylate transporter substrate binding protein [Alcaligenaceae bacterium]|nr:tripartite tricarboxylate transporter substrate binding protein [Alcaligenaceae bacterium]